MSRLASYLQNLQRFGIRPGLERIEALLASVDHPHRKYPHILVGGTNGKGSTCEFAARLLAQNGRRVGLFTSPHLYEWNERIRVLPGVGLFEGAIEDDELDALFDDGLPHIEAVAAKLGQPTEFEVLTFLGLWHFARAGVDAAVIEVGLGGKWDATNASDPLVSVVTHVALDHMDRLGNTLEEIAADKVCIARRNQPFVTGEWRPEVLRVFEDHCGKIGTLVEVVKPLFADDFQQRNKHLAQNIVRVFGAQVGWDVSTHEVEVPILGRHEILQHHPRLMIDGANNPEGAAALVDFLNHDSPSHGRIILVLGILKDKNWREMTQTLVGEADVVICCQSDSPRALDALELSRYAQQFCQNAEVVRDVKLAVERARELANPDDTILVTGSFTTIAEVPRSVSFDSSP
jgi:dihydrofolate synthase/folylpolyglutamate synthase